MRKIIQTIFFCCFVFTSNAQKNKDKNVIGISIPVIWNSSKVILRSSKIESGNAISYGINFNYSRKVASKIYGLIGLGFFKQSFAIERGFDLSSNSFGPALFTKAYSYSNLHLRLGLGYDHKLGENLSLNGLIDFNEYYSFRQKYNSKEIVNNNSMSIGESVNLHLGITEKLFPNFSIGTNLLFPFLVHWKTDKSFYTNPEIARNKLSLGIEFSGKYHF